ncbi:MAG: dehydrogenase [Saprospiraceae bacterium]|nr:MAG: dehydrogenase [Saprospiraceae bacterium]
MFDEFYKKAEDLRKKNEPFATAIVVRREEPSSGKSGDKAIINKYGEIWGWVGGGCTRSIILSEAEKAMQEGMPRLVRVTPEADAEPTSGVTAYKMTCHSGGTVEVFIEPILPRAHLVVIGKSAIAQSLVRLGHAMDYMVTAVAPGAGIDTFEKVDELYTKMDLSGVSFSPFTFLVIATQGEQDEAALSEALKAERPYIAFVASRKKRDKLFAQLQESGIKTEQLDRIKSPAGLDINAKLPEEVAISILAEIIQINRSEARGFQTFVTEINGTTASNNLYINPVCGIPIDKATAKHILDYAGEKVYFCCDGCKDQFEANPAKFVLTA